MYNLIELSHDIDFVQHIVVHPDLVFIMYSPAIVDICRSTFASQLPVQQLSYDTTFTLGDFYLSILLFRETEFVSSPIVPLAIMLHERKTQATHDLFFKHLSSAFPAVAAASNCIIVTDNERAITQSIANHVPAIPHFLCRNHVLQDAKRWLRDHGVSSTDEVNYYLDCMRSLFSSVDASTYKDSLLQYFLGWSQPFSVWFTDCVNPVIDKLASWALAQYDLKQVTTNQSESFNFVLKQLQVS